MKTVKFYRYVIWCCALILLAACQVMPRQDIPEIDGLSEPIKVTPKPSKTPSDFCKKYPGKFGCP